MKWSPTFTSPWEGKPMEFGYHFYIHEGRDSLMWTSLLVSFCFQILWQGEKSLVITRPQEITVCVRACVFVCLWYRALWPELIYSKRCPLTNRSQNINQPMKIKGGSLTIYKIFGNKVNKVQGTACEQGIFLSPSFSSSREDTSLPLILWQHLS